MWLCTHISRGASRGLTDGLKTARLFDCPTPPPPLYIWHRLNYLQDSIHFKYWPISYLCSNCVPCILCAFKNDVSSQVDVCTVLSVQVRAFFKMHSRFLFSISLECVFPITVTHSTAFLCPSVLLCTQSRILLKAVVSNNHNFASTFTLHWSECLV